MPLNPTQEKVNEILADIHSGEYGMILIPLPRDPTAVNRHKIQIVDCPTERYAATICWLAKAILADASKPFGVGSSASIGGPA